MTKRRGFMDDLSSETQSARAKKNKGKSPWRAGPLCSTHKAHKQFAKFKTNNGEK